MLATTGLLMLDSKLPDALTKHVMCVQEVQAHCTYVKYTTLHAEVHLANTACQSLRQLLSCECPCHYRTESFSCASQVQLTKSNKLMSFKNCRQATASLGLTCRPYRLPALDRAVALSGLPAAGPLLKGDIRSFILEVCPSGVVG